MSAERLYFFRLKAADAALMIGIFEVISIVQLYFSWGFIAGMVSTDTGHSEMDFIDITEGLAVVFVFLLICPVLLITGILRRSRCLMVPWLVVGWFKACTCFLIFIPIPFMPKNNTLRVFYTLSAIFSYCVSTYFLFPVCSCFKQMKHQRLVVEANVMLPSRSCNEMWAQDGSLTQLVLENNAGIPSNCQNV